MRLWIVVFFFFVFQAEDGIRDLVRSRGLGDVYKRQVQHEILEFLNIDMELKVEWLNDCEYNLIFIKNKNKKFSFYEPGEIINIKISEIRGNEYDCFVKNKRGTIKTTLIKIE